MELVLDERQRRRQRCDIVVVSSSLSNMDSLYQACDEKFGLRNHHFTVISSDLNVKC